MVNIDRVKERLLRGLYVGVGTVASEKIGNFLANQTNSTKGVAAGQIAIGAALSVGVDEVLDSPRSLPNDFGEFAGYGIQAAGWDEMAEAFDLSMTSNGSQTGARVVDISAHADREQENRPGSGEDVSMTVA